MNERPAPAAPAWNFLVTSVEGQREWLLRALRTFARFRRGGYPNVLVATVEDPLAFLAVLRDALEASAILRASLGKAVPIERTLRFAGPPEFLEVLSAVLVPLVDRLVGRTFFVRIHRRGFRQQIDSTAVEGRLGERLVAALAARGDAPRVRFADPDVVVAIETIRDEAGIALLPRELRAAYPFVRVR